MHEEKLLNDVRFSLREYTLKELDIWRRHVIDNPYTNKEISDRIVDVLNDEIVRRMMLISGEHGSGPGPRPGPR
jgi:hypothetical protein